MRISLILAVSRNNVIGLGNTLPWNIPEDLKRFKKLTMGHPVLLGRRSFLAIGRALPGRTNIIITRQKDFSSPWCSPPNRGLVAHSIEEAVKLAEQQEPIEAFVIGGAQVFDQTLGLATRIHMTRIHRTFEGDTFFPELGNEWREVDREDRLNAKPFPYSFITLERNL